MSKFIKISLAIVILIIILAVGLALYFKPSFIFPVRTDNANALAVHNSQDVGIGVNTKAPSGPTSGPSYTYSPFKAIAFIDNNANGSEDSGENICGSCFMRLVVCAKTIDNSLPKTADLFNLTIGNGGSIPSDKLAAGATCWASFDDKKIYIPPFKFDVGDSSAEVDVPVLNATGTLMGINMNLKSINLSSDKSYIYEFDLLIPILQAQYNNKKEVWLKYTPNLSAPDMYFMKSAKIENDSTGSVTGIVGTYYLKVNWGFSESYSTSKTIENYTIVM